MTLVRIIKSWTSPDLLRQTPGGLGIWDNCRFTLDSISKCDYLIVLNRPPRNAAVDVDPSRIWSFMQEPPERIYRWLRRGFKYYARIHTQDTKLNGPKIIHTHGSLPWHVNRTYDQLVAETAPPTKTGDLSWITSNLALTAGHRRRLRFLKRLQAAQVPFELYGRGFRPIPDKYDGLAPFRYSLAIEKMSCEHYWTEKLADCFLAWTVPIYYGATRLDDYFPKNSYIPIDIHDPRAPQKVAEIIRSDFAERNRDAIAEARRRVLQEHNLFPRVARLIAENEVNASASIPQTAHLPKIHDLTHYYIKHSLPHRVLRSVARRLRGKLSSKKRTPKTCATP